MNTQQIEKEKELKEIELCVLWIKNVATITQTINKWRTSYGYKHDVENHFKTYISNDSFKIAARQCGLIIEQATGQNEWYNLSFEK